MIARSRDYRLTNVIFVIRENNVAFIPVSAFTAAVANASITLALIINISTH